MKAIPQTLKFSQQNALKMALDFIKKENGLSIKESTLVRQYGLTRSTLARISKGEAMSRSYDKYLCLFVKVLTEYMRSPINAAKQEKRQQIRALLADMMQVHCGIPTDAEIRDFEWQKKYGVR